MSMWLTGVYVVDWCLCGLHVSMWFTCVYVVDVSMWLTCVYVVDVSMWLTCVYVVDVCLCGCASVGVWTVLLVSGSRSTGTRWWWRMQR